MSKTQIAYLSPAALAEEVLIRTHLIEYSHNRLVVEGEMLDRTARRLKAVAWMEFVYVSLLSGRRTSHPETMMELFRQVQLPGVFTEDGFNRRVSELRAERRAFAHAG